MTALHLNTPVIVTPTSGAPYAARFAQRGNGGLIYVRGPQGLHAVPEGSVTPRVLDLGDDKAVRHEVRS